MRAVPIFTQYLAAVDNVCARRYDDAVVVHDGIHSTGFARYEFQQLVDDFQIIGYGRLLTFLLVRPHPPNAIHGLIVVQNALRGIVYNPPSSHVVFRPGFIGDSVGEAAGR